MNLPSVQQLRRKTEATDCVCGATGVAVLDSLPEVGSRGNNILKHPFLWFKAGRCWFLA